MLVGALYEASGQRDRAVEHYERALALEPDRAPALNNLANLLAETDPDRALEFARTARRLMPDEPATGDTLGWLLYLHGDATKAIEPLRQSEAGLPVGDPRLGLVRYHLARAYETAGDVDAARTTLLRALVELDLLREATRRSTGAYPPDPPWAVPLRSMLARLPEPSAPTGTPRG